MSGVFQSPVWLLPGWQNSGPDHWQTHWEQAHGARRIEQHDWMCPLRGDWVMRLQECLMQVTQPVLLVAHSLGCHLVAAWAAQSGLTSRVRAALLVAPPDCTRADFPAPLHSWRQPVLQPLPFAAHVLASSNDPYCGERAALQMARAWAAPITRVGPLGHLNAASGLRIFESARQALLKLEQSALH
jgi:uncharacterized protein